MKKAVKIASVVLAISLLLVSLCGCNLFKSDEQLIRERVEEFLSSYNSGDIDGAFECFDATTRNMMEAMMNIGEGIFGEITGMGVSMSDLFALAMGINGGEFLSMEITNIEITSDTTATVTLNARVSSEMMGVDESQEDIQMEMVKEDGDWYINGRSGTGLF